MGGYIFCYMRSFVAVDVRNPQLEQVLRELGSLGAGMKVVASENLHLTLKFLGEVDPGRVDEIYGAMEEAFGFCSPFQGKLRGLGAFPSPGRMRVVWVGLSEGRERLLEMQGRLEGAFAKLGFRPEGRPFDPHLTIGRVKSPKGKEELTAFVLARQATDFGTFAVERVELKESTLTPRGPIYKTLKAYAL